MSQAPGSPTRRARSRSLLNLYSFCSYVQARRLREFEHRRTVGRCRTPRFSSNRQPCLSSGPSAPDASFSFTLKKSRGTLPETLTRGGFQRLELWYPLPPTSFWPAGKHDFFSDIKNARAISAGAASPSTDLSKSGLPQSSFASAGSPPISFPPVTVGPASEPDR